MGTVHTNMGRANFLFLALFLKVGSVRSPFARWTHGRVTFIAPWRLMLWIKDESSGTTEAFSWDKDTLLWIDSQRQESGAVFDPEQLSVGAEVRVMFKTHATGNRLSRVIQIPPPAELPETLI
jgi:hypothetical protein